MHDRFRGVTLTWAAAAALGVGAAASGQTEAEPTDFNDTFESRTILSPGTLNVTAELFSDFAGPDTIMRAFVDGSEWERDDDSSSFGDGFASALFDVPISLDGQIDLEVSGFGDGQDSEGEFVEEFTGNHTEFGFYSIFIDVFDDTGGSIEFFQETGFLSDGVVDVFSIPAPPDAATYIAEIDNSVGDVDYFEFTGLDAETPYSVEITSNEFLDTLLAEIDADGSILQTDDDGGQDNLSQLDLVSDATGELRVAVTGFPDFGFFNEHGEQGLYEITLTALVDELLGDYNGDGFVSQADLDLVLLNWGDSTVPAGWVAVDQFDGVQVSQNELDGVLLNWGNGTPPAPAIGAVPEPGGALLLAGLGGLILRRRAAA